MNIALKETTLYFWRGLVYVLMLTLATILFKRLGMSNATILLQTSWLLLPSALKPLISPWVKKAGETRFFILSMELMTVVATTGITFAIASYGWRTNIIAFLWLLAICNAIHDIAADELFLQRPPRQRPSFVGFTQTFAVQLALLIGAGILVMVAGNMEVVSRRIRPSWTLVFRAITVIFIILLLINVIILPRNPNFNLAKETIRGTYDSFVDRLATMMKRVGIWPGLLFLLFFLTPEVALMRGSTLFMLDPGSAGGLALSPQELALVKGTVGVLAFSVGIMVGRTIPWDSRPYWPLWTLAALCLTVPNFAYVYMSFNPRLPLSSICFYVTVEQFFAGIAVSAYIHFLIDYCNRRRGLPFTACVSLASLALLLASLLAAYLLMGMGWRRFFFTVSMLGIVSLAVTLLLALTYERREKK